MSLQIRVVIVVFLALKLYLYEWWGAFLYELVLLYCNTSPRSKCLKSAGKSVGCKIRYGLGMLSVPLALGVPPARWRAGVFAGEVRLLLNSGCYWLPFVNYSRAVNKCRLRTFLLRGKAD